MQSVWCGDLGFDAKNFPNVQFRPDLKDKVLNDILYPKYSANEPSHLIPRLLYKYRRWQEMLGNRNCVIVKADGQPFGMDYGHIC